MSEETTQPPKKPKRKFDITRLPTPPPDPTEKNDFQKEDFIAYLDSLQKSSSKATFAPVIATEDAFEHLEKLYKLMEQMLELREQNAKLYRRVRDLEHLHNLKKMHKQLNTSFLDEHCPELDKDTAFAETILESILAETKSKPKSTSARLKQSISRKPRNRSGSATEKTMSPMDVGEQEASRRASTCVDNRFNKSAKVSKWTKVKAAFKWEKASPTVSDAKSQDSGIGGMTAVNLEVARYLRVPSTSEDAGHSPADSGAAEISTPGSLSTASSNEDFQHNELLTSPCEDFKSSDDEHSHSYIPRSKNGSQKSTKSHRTPWAKMKDIIQTRNSFKKKHRLSAQSDDIQIDVELCSDNEEVFEEDRKQTPSPNICSKIYTRVDSSEIPAEIIARYQQLASDDEPKKISKWTRVKQAFLPPTENNHNVRKEFAKAENDSKNIQAEIQRNYKQLQKKLSLEFQEKLCEWERIKQHSPGSSIPSSSFFDESRDAAFRKKMEEWQKIKSQPSRQISIQMTSSDNLAPDFRRKLQEWEKIKKSSVRDSGSKKKLGEGPKWKSMSYKSDQSPVFEYPQLSDDFKKKLEEWRQIKSGANTPNIEEKNNKTPSPGLLRKDSSPKHSNKFKDSQDKELHWYEKELGKIEKEKLRLEKEKQKFLEREERLSKLRSSVVGGIKKEVLIHTASGFYRFEGISRKFTQKLYEWEKAQGIGPESSTFALLNSSYAPDFKSTTNITNTASLTRSKSADSIAMSGLNLNTTLISHQPSSLSLNNMDDLEKECLAVTKSSSVQYISHCNEDEPEALIVEVEDIVEETAAPLDCIKEKIQQPVYQHEEIKALCEGETCIAPKIRRSESTRAQNNYNLIEEIFNLLKNLTENEIEIQKTLDQNLKKKEDLLKLQEYNESQMAMASHLSTKITRLQGENVNVIISINKEDQNCNSFQFRDQLDSIQDISTEILNLTKKLNTEINGRNVFEFEEIGARSCCPIMKDIKNIRTKLLELRRHLSYICARTDMTTPGKKKKKKCSEEIQEKSKDGRLYIKSETSNVQSQGAIKKRIRYRQKSSQSRSIPDSDEEDDSPEQKRSKFKKLGKTKSVSEDNTKQKTKESEIVVDEAILEKVVVPTKTNFVNVANIEQKKTDSPVTVFVKTTRKLFTPLVESGFNGRTSISDNFSIKDEEKKTSINHLPPLPGSPATHRKLKEISPSIRLILAKYNQKISEQDTSKSGGSSGSASPVTWRSPSAERRVKAQTERYEDRLSPLLGGRREVKKSASMGYIQQSNHKQITLLQRNQMQSQESTILKSSSASVIPFKKDSISERKNTNLKLVIGKFSHSPEIRQRKLQKAKEDFLNSAPTSAPPQLTDSIKFPTRNRLSQISVDSESSNDSAFNGALMKSASAGMINIDVESFKQFSPEVHEDGYVSLPRSTNKKREGLLTGKFVFSSIASKFRKVKMRKGKDKMNVVSTLCRQSLVVDINNGDIISSEDISASSSSSKSGLWTKTKLFKK